MNKYLKLGLCSLIIVSMVALVFHRDKLTRFPASFNAKELEAQAKFKSFDKLLLQKIEETKNLGTATYDQMHSFTTNAGVYSNFISHAANEFYEDHQSFSQEYFDTVLFPYAYKYLAEILPAAHKLVAAGHHNDRYKFLDWEGIDKMLALVIPKELVVQLLVGYQVGTVNFPGLKLAAQSLSYIDEKNLELKNFAITDINTQNTLSMSYHHSEASSYTSPFTSKIPYKILNGENFVKNIQEYWKFRNGFTDIPFINELSLLKEQAKVNLIEEDKSLIESSVLAELLEFRLKQIVTDKEQKFSGKNIKDPKALSLYMKIVKFHKVKSDFVNKWAVLRFKQSTHDLVFSQDAVAKDLLTFKAVNNRVPYYDELWQMDWYYNVYRKNIDQLRIEIKQSTLDTVLENLEPHYLGKIKLARDKIWQSFSKESVDSQLSQSIDQYAGEKFNEYLISGKDINEAQELVRSEIESFKTEKLKEIELKESAEKLAYDKLAPQTQKKQYFLYFYVLKKIYQSLQASNLSAAVKKSLLIAQSYDQSADVDQRIIDTFFTSRRGDLGQELENLENAQQLFLSGLESIPAFLKYLPNDSKDLESQAFYLAQNLFTYIFEPFKQAIVNNYFDTSELKALDIENLKELIDVSLEDVRIAWIKKNTLVLRNQLKKIEISHKGDVLKQRNLNRTAHLLTSGQGIKASHFLNKYFPFDRSSTFVSTKGMRHLIYSFPELFAADYGDVGFKELKEEFIDSVKVDALKLSSKEVLAKIIKEFTFKHLYQKYSENKNDERLTGLKQLENKVVADLLTYSQNLRLEGKSHLIGDFEKIQSIDSYLGEIFAIAGTIPLVYFQSKKEGEEAQQAYFGACDWTKEGFITSTILYEMIWMPIKGLIAPKAAERARETNQNDFRYSPFCGQIKMFSIDRNVNEESIFRSVRPLPQEKIKFTSSEMLTRVVGQWIKFYQPHILFTLVKDQAKKKIVQDFFAQIKSRFTIKLNAYLEQLEKEKRGYEYSVVDDFLNSSDMNSREQELMLQGILDPYRKIYGAIDTNYLNQELWNIIVEVAREARQTHGKFELTKFTGLSDWDLKKLEHNAQMALSAEQDAPFPRPNPLPPIQFKKEGDLLVLEPNAADFKEFIIDKPMSLMIPDINPLSENDVALFKELHFEEIRKDFNGKIAFIDTLGQENYAIDAELGKQFGISQIDAQDLGGYSHLNQGEGSVATSSILDEIFRFMGIDEEILKGAPAGESRLENNVLGQFYLAQMVESNITMEAGYLKMLADINIPNNFPNRMTYLDQCQKKIEVLPVEKKSAQIIVNGQIHTLYNAIPEKAQTIETLKCTTGVLDHLSRDQGILEAVFAENKAQAQELIISKQNKILAREIDKETRLNLEEQGVLTLNSNTLTDMKSDKHKDFFDQTKFIRKQLIENPYSVLFKSMGTSTSADLETAQKEDVMGTLAKVDLGLYQKVKPFWYFFDQYLEPFVGMLGLLMILMIGGALIFSVASVALAPLAGFVGAMGTGMTFTTVIVTINVGFILIDSMNAYKYFHKVPVAFEKQQSYVNRSYFYSGDLDLTIEIAPMTSQDILEEMKEINGQQRNATFALVMDLLFLPLDIHDFYQVSKLVRAKYISRIAGKGVRTSELTLKNMKNFFFSSSDYTKVKSFVLMRDYVKTLVNNNELVKSLRLTKSQFAHLEGLSLYDQLRQLSKGSTEIHFRNNFDQKFSLELINDLESILKKNGLFARIGRYDYLKTITDPDVLKFAHLMEKMKLEVDQKMILLLSNKSMVKETLENLRKYIADPHAVLPFTPLKKLINDNIAHEAYPWFDLTLKNQFDQHIDLWAQEVLSKMKDAGDLRFAHYSDAIGRKKYLLELEELRLKNGINSTSLDDILAKTVKEMVDEIENMEPMLEAIAKDIYTLDEAYRVNPTDTGLLSRLKLKFEDVAVRTFSFLNVTPTYKFKNSYQWLYGKDLRPASIKDASLGGWSGMLSSLKDGSFMPKLWSVMQKTMKSAYVPISPDINKMKGLLLLNDDINKMLISLRAGSYKSTSIKDYLAIIHHVKKNKLNFELPTHLPGGQALDLTSEYDKLFLGFYSLTKKHESFDTFLELTQGNMVSQITGIYKRTAPGVSKTTIMGEVGFHQELIQSFKNKEGGYLLEKNLLKESTPEELKFEQFMEKMSGL
jgi:hypothetical protein